jgi:hypothetical protein
MRTCLKFIIPVFALSLILPNCKGQEAATISQPQLIFLNDSLIIRYDILGAQSGDKFNVRLEITDADGKKINARNIKGDIGDGINAGRNKQITWNLSADNIFLNTNINVEIIARKIIMPVKAAGEKDVTEKIPDEGKEKKSEAGYTDAKTSEKASSKVKTGKHLLQSALFPGWGLTSLSKGKPYWLIGVAGAGCIASSVYFNYQASSNYDNYLDTYDAGKIDTYFNKANTQNNISKAFAVTAAVIWVADLGIVGIKARNMNRSTAGNKLNTVSISSYIEPNTNAPVISLYLNF